MNSRQGILLSVIAAVTLGLTACGGSSGSTPPPATVTVSISGQPAALTTSATASITATVSNNTGVTWTVTCAATPCGSFNPASTASGAATTFTAPTAPTSVTITATTSSGTTASATATISITAPVITVAFNPAAPVSINAGANSPLTAVVTNDPKSAGVTWKVTCGSSACGSFNPASTASGTATTYTAPAAIPSPNTVTVTATSVTDTTKSASATITIGAPPPVLADGTYVYHFSGWDSTGPSFFAGAFTVAGGVITGGEQDFTDASIGYSLNTVVPANSSLSAAGNNIQVVLGISNTSLGANGIETLRGTVVSSSRILITEFDTFGTGTGSIDLQTTPVAPPSGGYAFIVSGWDINSSTNPATIFPFAIGGVLNISGTSLSTGGSVYDYNLGNYGPPPNMPLIAQAQLFSSGSISGPDAFGRVSISLVPASTSNLPSFILTGYVVSPGQIQLVESQADNLNDDLGGMALGQGANTGKFSPASLATTSYVFASSGEDINSSGPFTGLANFGGSLSFSSTGAITGTLAINDGTNFVATGITSGSYTVDATGRASLTNIVTSQFPGAAFTFQLYLDGNGNALHLGADILEVTSGPAYLKTATSNDFEGSYALAGSGIIQDTNLDAWAAVGPVTVTSDSLTGSADYNAQGTPPTSAGTVTAMENSSAGTLNVVGLDSSALTAPRLYSYFPIDSKRVLAIEIDGNQLGILTLETITH
jgi:hypothetical protein